MSYKQQFLSTHKILQTNSEAPLNFVLKSYFLNLISKCENQIFIRSYGINILGCESIIPKVENCTPGSVLKPGTLLRTCTNHGINTYVTISLMLLF